MLKLTKENYLKAGQQIMSDPRCDDAVKDAVRRGTTGEQDSNGLMTYYTTNDGNCDKKNEWYDLILIELAE